MHRTATRPPRRRTRAVTVLALVACALTSGAIAGHAQSTTIRPLDGTLPLPPQPVIVRVVPNSPAARAGLVAGDTLWSIDGTPIASVHDLTRVLERSRGTVRARVGRWSGRGEIPVQVEGNPPRIGAYLPGVVVDSEGVQIDDDARSVVASAHEWGGLTVVWVGALNRSARPLGIGPESVVIVDGHGSRLTPLSTDRAIALVYGPEAATPWKRLGSDSGPPTDAPDLRDREEGVRYLRGNALKSTTLARNRDARGTLYFDRTGIAQPIAVRVTLAGRMYTLRFGRARR